MKISKNFIQICLLFGIAVFVFFSIDLTNSIGQQDPNRDRPYIREGFTPSPVLYEPDAPVTINDFDNFYVGVDFAEGNVAQNPRNPLWSFAPYNINGTHYTIDGFNFLVNNPSFPGSVAGDPVAAYDSLGNLYYDNMKSPVTGTWVVKSTNGGVSWQTGVAANIGADKNWICADQTAGPYSNYIYGAMTSSTSGANVVRSTNLGVSFSQVFTASPHSLPGAMTCVGAFGSVQGGAVYVVTNAGSSFASVYTFFRSTDGGTTFTSMSSQYFSGYVGTMTGSPARNSVQNMRTRPYPFIAADNSFGAYRGRFYVVYASNNPAGNGNKSDIFCRYSTDGGVTFSPEVIVNDDPNSQNNYQWHPAPWCDKETGKLYVQWMDTRDCPTSDSALIYASYSTNGGQSFVTNQQVSNKKMKINCTYCGGGGTPMYLGDYNGITSNSKCAILSWADFRNNNFASYLSYFPDYAMRVDPAYDSINSNNGQVTFLAGVPATKLYTDTVIFSAAITPTPGVGTLTITFPSGNKLSSFPGSVPVKVTAAGGVSQGTYTLTITGVGPNGTPVHKRTASLYASGTIAGIVGENETPNKYELSQNYPNPFNPVTKIDFNLLYKSDVNITVFNTLGKAAATYNMQNQGAGKHYLIFNARDLSSGVYYYRINAGEFTDTKKMLLLK